MSARRRSTVTDTSLRDWLRLGDPLTEGEPNDDQIRRLRGRMLAEARLQRDLPSSRRLMGGWLLPGRVAGVAAVVVLVALGITATLRIIRPSGSPNTQPTAGSGPVAAGAPDVEPPLTLPDKSGGEVNTPPASVRRAPDAAPVASLRSGAEREDGSRRLLQVHFVTPGGTRIVWVLNPDLRLD